MDSRWLLCRPAKTISAGPRCNGHRKRTVETRGIKESVPIKGDLTKEKVESRTQNERHRQRQGQEKGKGGEGQMPDLVTVEQCWYWAPKGRTRNRKCQCARRCPFPVNAPAGSQTSTAAPSSTQRQSVCRQGMFTGRLDRKANKSLYSVAAELGHEAQSAGCHSDLPGGGS